MLPLTLLILLILLLQLPNTSSLTAPTILRVCIDKDCQIDGCGATLDLAKALAPSSVKVETCGCLGPCGGGPNIDLRTADGVRIKDKRTGRSNFYCFKEGEELERSDSKIRRPPSHITNNPSHTRALPRSSSVKTPEDMKEVLKVGAGIDVDNKQCNLPTAASTRGLLDFDRTTRIAFQRLLYIVTFLPMQDAYQKGTWDTIMGTTYENSFAAIGAVVLVGSQFMGTGASANSGVNADIKAVTQIAGKLTNRNK